MSKQVGFFFVAFLENLNFRGYTKVNIILSCLYLFLVYTFFSYLLFDADFISNSLGNVPAAFFSQLLQFLSLKIVDLAEPPAEIY